MTEKLITILTSHSIDNLFDYCPRKFEFLQLHDVRPPRDSGFAAQVGTALHDGMQAWLVARANHESETDATRKAYWAMLLAYPWAMEQEQYQKTRSIENTCLMLYEMIRSTFWDDWDLMWVEGKGWAVEIPFLIQHKSLGTFPIASRPGETAQLGTQGKIDLVMRHRVTGKKACIDIKTTVTPKELVEAEYKWSGQQVGYDAVVKTMTQADETEPVSVFYFVCLFSGQYAPEILSVEMPKTQENVDDYWLGKLDRLRRIKDYAMRGWFPRTNGGCHTWGQQCGFFDICQNRDPALVKRWFEIMESVPQEGYDYWVTMEA